jgi:hypothetical protein
MLDKQTLADKAKLATNTTSQDAIDSRPSFLRNEGGNIMGPDRIPTGLQFFFKISRAQTNKDLSPAAKTRLTHLLRVAPQRRWTYVLRSALQRRLTHLLRSAPQRRLTHLLRSAPQGSADICHLLLFLGGLVVGEGLVRSFLLSSAVRVLSTRCMYQP